MNPLAKVLPFPGRRRRPPGGKRSTAAEATPSDLETAPARYALKPGLELLSQDQGGVLLCLRPLLAMRLNRQGFALLSRIEHYLSSDELAIRVPGLTPAAIGTFLDSLVRHRLLSRRPPVTGDWPLVSIIIPAHGRPEATRACVRSLLELDYPADCREIIVVDDASEPPLAPWLADLPIRLLRQEHNIGQSAARNLAAAAARGTVLAFIDNDCVAEADWLRTLVPYLNEPGIGIVGGKVAAPPTQGPVAAFEAVRSPLDMGAVETEVAPGAPVSYLPTCNLLVRRELLLSQSGFDAGMRLGEDVDFIWRTLQTGARACYVPAGRIVHDHRVQLGALLRRRADYGSSEADLQRRHPQGRRVMPLPLVNLLLLLMLALLPDAWPLGLAALGLVGLELIDKQRRLKRLDVLVPLGWTIRALGREHAASLYHLSANVVRYYSLPLLILGGVQPGLLPVLLLLFLVAPVGDYRRRRPNLSLPRFVGLYWLEMAAYQLGVWRGCWRRCTLRPLLPKLRLQR